MEALKISGVSVWDIPLQELQRLHTVLHFNRSSTIEIGIGHFAPPMAKSFLFHFVARGEAAEGPLSLV
jgi:hypothetical protein